MKDKIWILLLCLCSCFGKDLFLGEKHEYGYFPIDNRQPQYKLFYWLFKARNGDSRAPLIVWVEGGPGCSSEQALFMEHGPYRIIKNSTEFYLNPYAWNTAADVLFVDSPIGTGLSNCSNVERIPTDGDWNARDFMGFFSNFLVAHTNYNPLSTKLYIAGHSYAGHFIPAIVSYSLKIKFPFKFEAILLGNPFSNPHSIAWSYPEFAYKHNLIPFYIYSLGKILYNLYELFSNTNMPKIAMYFFKLVTRVVEGYHKLRFNPMDIRNVTMPTREFEKLMYTKILKAIGLDNRHWQNCNPIISLHRMELDHITDYTPYIEEALNKSIPVLFYYGAQDFVCNVLSGEKMFDSLHWHGAKEFKEEQTHSLWTNGRLVGEYKHFSNMWYLKVYEAGHIVFFNDPEFGFDMISKVLH